LTHLNPQADARALPAIRLVRRSRYRRLWIQYLCRRAPGSA